MDAVSIVIAVCAVALALVARDTLLKLADKAHEAKRTESREALERRIKNLEANLTRINMR